MMDQSRTEILVGIEGVEKLRRSTVMIIGLGGVGGHAAEAIVRAGAGHVIIADYDKVAPSNLNRQILSLTSSIGKLKTEVATERFNEINSEIKITSYHERITPENIGMIFPETDKNLYAVDAIDEIDSKIALIIELKKRGIPFVSSMGAGSRLNPSLVKVDDISRTEHCPLARVMRKRLRNAGIEKGVRCVYSTENLNRFAEPEPGSEKKRQGSISFMPAIFGLTAAGVIINDIIS
ncbi:MAG TPA: tRNA threonylcarbamoyladenosine dehydratase [Spirochaetota bacterium]|nr:tRNA threonylcarbamoyladenosine dehydratase [Spirochaetota bacterium]HPJ35803.1 tRNA threonylcarbamoyladenosine dehydratase [Spirochaetota bacterium]